MKTLALAIFVFLSGQVLQASAISEMTWDQVFELRDSVLQSEDRVVDGSSFDPTRTLSIPLSFNEQQSIVEAATTVAQELGPVLDRLVAQDIYFRGSKVEGAAKHSVVLAAYTAVAMRLTSWLMVNHSIGSTLRLSAKSNQNVAKFISIASSVDAQLSRQSTVNIGTRRPPGHSRSSVLSMVETPTVQTMANDSKELSRQIRIKIQDKNIRSEVFKSLSADLQACMDNQRSFDRAFNINLFERNPIGYKFRELALGAVSYVYTPRSHYITDKMIDDLNPRLEPGDLALIRHKYKMTNLGIRGRFAHSILILGAPEKTLPYFDEDQETQSYFANLCRSESLKCSNFSTYMQAKFPKSFSKYLGGDKYKGRVVPIQAIESLRPGVVLSNIYDAIRKDKLAVFRPNLSKKDRAAAIAKAFQYVGVPYDYRFDLETEDRMICTELLVYAYQSIPSLDKNGLSFKINERKGTKITYPDDVAFTFLAQATLPNSQLSLVTYIGEVTSAATGSARDSVREMTLDDLKLEMSKSQIPK